MAIDIVVDLAGAVLGSSAKSSDGTLFMLAAMTSQIGGPHDGPFGEAGGGTVCPASAAIHSASDRPRN